MIKAVFFINCGVPVGFRVSGHSGYSESGNDIVCAYVSSAVQMTANTITESIGAKADVGVADGNTVYLMLKKKNSAEKIISVSVIEGLYVHLFTLSEDYGDNIAIAESEVF